MNRKIDFSVGEFYHIYNRGVDKRTIFTNNNDYNRFILLLYLCNSSDPVDISNKLREGRTFTKLFELERGKQLVDIGAYCLMPNHFHLLFHERESGGLSQFMKKFSTAYVMYFNKKNNRKGALFEGKFKAEHVDGDEYLKYLFAYIHLNPVKLIDSRWKVNGIKDKEGGYNFLNEYKYSSYLDYKEKVFRDVVGPILTKDAFPEYFERCEDFEELIKYWLDYTNLDK